MLGGSPSVEPEETESELEDDGGTPGMRSAFCGIGGGGISFESIKRTFGRALEEEDSLCALFKEGNAGGVSVSLPSLSSSSSPFDSGSEASIDTSVSAVGLLGLGSLPYIQFLM